MAGPELINHYNLEAKVYHGADGYHAVWTVGGKRVKRQFKSAEEARKAARAALKQIHSGKDGLAIMKPAEMAKVAASIELLKAEGHHDILGAVNEFISAKRTAKGADLAEAAKHWAGSHRGIERISLEDAANDWLKTYKEKWSPSYRNSIEKRLRKVLQSLQIDACDLEYEGVRLFLGEGLKGQASKSKNHYREILRRVVAHCVDRNWIHEKHGLGKLLKNERVDHAAPKTASPAEFAQMLEAADDELLPLIAIQGFCGPRQKEVMRMTWENVWRVPGYIELNADQTKTRQRRLVPRSASLEQWLEPYRQFTGKLWSSSDNVYCHALDDLKKLAGISGRNILRHSYASYRLAVVQDSAKVAFEMGNSPDIVYRHYWDLVTEEEAKGWFSILPRGAKNRIVLAAS